MVVQFKGKTQILFFILPRIKIIFISFFALFLSISSKSLLSFSTLTDTSLAPIPPSSSPKLSLQLAIFIPSCQPKPQCRPKSQAPSSTPIPSPAHLSLSRHLAHNAQDKYSKMKPKKEVKVGVLWP